MRCIWVAYRRKFNAEQVARRLSWHPRFTEEKKQSRPLLTCEYKEKSQDGRTTKVKPFILTPNFTRWALGVIVYLAIYGKLPFWQANVLSLAEEIDKKEPIYPQPASPKIVDFIKKLLLKDCSKRMTVEQAMVHPWTTMDGQNPIEDEETELITVTEQDVKSAIRPLQTLFMLINLRAKMKRKLKVCGTFL